MWVESSRKGAGHDAGPGASRGQGQRLKLCEWANHPRRRCGMGRERGRLQAPIILCENFPNILKNPGCLRIIAN